MNMLLAGALMVGAIILYDNLPRQVQPAFLLFLATIIAGMVIGNYDKVKSQIEYIFKGKD